YGTELGLHADLFTSSVHDGVQYGQEFQFKAGLARETAGVSWDLFVNQHVYTGFEDTDANYWEVQMDVSRPIGPLTPVVSFVGSPDGYGAWGGYGFVGVESGYELPRGFALTAAAGRMMFTGDDPDQGDYTFVAGGVDWTHRTGVQLSFGVEVGGTRDQVHPTFRLGRAF
ncbi:MAG: hypothetical protein KY449_09310, partial [Proteobacteria bacterium]|nr:hypothetical protein [Pseudomonadota bacterium]